MRPRDGLRVNPGAGIQSATANGRRIVAPRSRLGTRQGHCLSAIEEKCLLLLKGVRQRNCEIKFLGI